MWIDIVEVFGQDGETRAEVLYKRLEATGLKHPDLAGLPHRAVAERCKEDEILIMDVEALVRFARRYQNRWQDCDILQVVRKIKKAGFYDSEKFAQMMVDSFTEACGSDPYSGRFRRLFPDLLNVETVNDKAVALAAIYATYCDENNESLNMGGGLRAEFQTKLKPIHYISFRVDCDWIYVIDKHERDEILQWVDEVSTACNPIAPAPSTPTGTETKPKRTPKVQTQKTTNEMCVAALMQHHEYEKPNVKKRTSASVGKHDPIGVREMDAKYDIASSTVSDFFKKAFVEERHKGYKAACANGTIADKILSLTATDWDRTVPLDFDPKVPVS